MKKIAIFTSGLSRGSNFLAIYNHIQKRKLPISIEYIVITNEHAPIKELANERGIKIYNIKPPVLNTEHKQLSINSQLITIILNHPADLIVLAGYMRKLNIDFFDKIKTPMINIHPSLLPKYGGKGMYGMNVHKAVFDAGEMISGATVHYVNEEYDGGKIITQKECDISMCQSPEEIAQTVLKVEHEIYPNVIENMLL